MSESHEGSVGRWRDNTLSPQSPPSTPPITADQVLALYIEGKTGAEIAGVLGVSRQRISQILGSLGLPGRNPHSHRWRGNRRGSPDHGTMARYKSGCHCDDCRPAQAEACREQAQKRRERAQADPTLVPHGTFGGYSNWRCRCAECRQAASTQNARRQLRTLT